MQDVLANVKFDAEGFMADANVWMPEIGQAIADRESLKLTDRHWVVINYARGEFKAKGQAPTLRAITKNTVVFAIILSAIPILVRVFKNFQRRYLWSGIALSGLLIISTTIRMEDAASWHRNTNQRLSTNINQGEAPIGRDSFQFNNSNGVFQLIPQKDLQQLRGKTVTLGSWMWADNPTQLQTPSLKYSSENIFQTVETSRKPSFYAFSTTLPDDLTELLITITPGGAPENEGRVYYDGIILVEGDFSDAGIPLSKNIDASQLQWNGSNIKNYVRNASAERTWFVIRSVASQLLDYYVPGTPELYLSLLQDWRSATGYYQLTLKNLLQTFWGKFGWGHVPLLGEHSYNILAFISLVGFGGAAIALVRQRRVLPMNAYLFLFLAGLIIWLFTILRGLTSIMELLFIPSARYAYPAIIPTVLAVNLGWLEIGRLLIGESNRWLLNILLVIFFVSLDILALVSVMMYYR